MYKYSCVFLGYLLPRDFDVKFPKNVIKCSLPIGSPSVIFLPTYRVTPNSMRSRYTQPAFLPVTSLLPLPSLPSQPSFNSLPLTPFSSHLSRHILSPQCGGLLATLYKSLLSIPLFPLILPLSSFRQIYPASL